MPVPKKNQLVGLDIGSHSIKLVEIDDSKKGMILKNFGIVHLPKDTIVEGSIKEIEVAATAIKNLFKNCIKIIRYPLITKRFNIKNNLI